MELARLRAQLALGTMERDILKKCHGVFRAGISVKCAWLASNKAHWPITLSCQVLGVSTTATLNTVDARSSPNPVSPVSTNA